MNGILLLNKPKGFTSFDAVAKLRGILRTKKIGHAGTLDPNAEGLLLVLVGNAARAADLLPDTDKVYRASCTFGISTDTEDVWGTIINEQPVSASKEAVERAILGFTGTYPQVPPMYSAKKINGQKLYNLARSGVTVEREPVPVTVYEIKDVNVTLPEASFTAHVSKGTYIRTLITDIAASIREIAAMSALTRVKLGKYDLSSAYRFEDLEKAKEENRLEGLLLPTDSVFSDLPGVHVLPEFESRLQNGNKLSTDMTEPFSEEFDRVRVYFPDGRFAALYSRCEDGLKPVKIFFER